MKLHVLESAARKVVAVTKEDADGSEKCPVTDFLHEQPKERSGTAKGFKSLFERYAEGGRNKLTKSLFHEVDSKENIWEFIKGSLRIFCYVDNDEKLVLLTHGTLKKTQKVSKKEVNHAISVKKKYLEAKKESNIILENVDDY